MTEENLFVGREAELKRFDDLLQSPDGQAIIVSGQPGMGKTALLDRITELLPNRPDLKCGAVRYEVTRTQSPESIMASMIDHAYEAANKKPGFFTISQQGRKQWATLFEVLIPKADKVVKLKQSLQMNPQQSTRDQFIDRLNLISQSMPDNGRAVFIIDPEKYLQKDNADDWRLVIQKLPPKIKFLIAQRPDDILVNDANFKAVPNVTYIPETGELHGLSDDAVEDLILLRTEDLATPIDEVREVIARYQGHPYCVKAALDLLNQGTALADLPNDPTPEGIAEAQWEKAIKLKETAIPLLKAYGILEIAVPNDVAIATADITRDQFDHLTADPYIRSLFRPEGDRQRIYHALLGDHIRTKLTEDNALPFHERARDIYRKRLTAQTKPDELAAVRLSYHVRFAEGDEAFLRSLANECMKPMYTLGIWDTAISLNIYALSIVEKGSKSEAVVFGNLGNVYVVFGDLKKAQEFLLNALLIDKELGDKKGIRADYVNLGNMYQTSGDLKKAEKYLLKALEIDEEGTASIYGALGNVYQTGGDLKKAKDFYSRSLAIFEELGDKEGMANGYFNLGSVYITCGDLKEGEEYSLRALAVYEKLGDKNGLARGYGSLGQVYITRGELSKAEAYFLEALAIDEKVGHTEGVAHSCGNLGILFDNQGEADKAREYWNRSRDCYEELGAPHMVEKVQKWLDDLDDA